MAKLERGYCITCYRPEAWIIVEHHICENCYLKNADFYNKSNKFVVADNQPSADNSASNN